MATQVTLGSGVIDSASGLKLRTNGSTEAVDISTGQVATLAQNPILTSGTANGVLYLNGSKVATSGSAVTYNGTTFSTTADASISGLTVGKGAGSVSTNTAVGASALATSTTGTGIVPIGSNAGSSAAVGNNNTLVGANTAPGVTGVANTFLGNGSGNQATTGTYNTGVGFVSLNNGVLTGANNTALGAYSLYNNTTASNNTAVGYRTGYANKIGRAHV